MDFFVKAFTNPILVVPTLAWLITQVIKSVINAMVNKKFSFSRLFGDGGMPSGHSATVMALSCMCGIEVGFDTPIFAVSAILAIIVMHDATGVRRETGKQATAIISIATVIGEYFAERDEQIKTEKLKVMVGHSPLQVVVGAILGVLVSLAYMWIFNKFI